MTVHKTVLLKEVLELLDPKSGENFIDGTFGGGGHSQAILEKIKPSGRLLAIDWNGEAIANCEERRGGSDIKCAQGNFANLLEIMRQTNFPLADGLLLDLGVSSDELETSGRGFSFQKDEPLLMTYSDEQKPVKQILKELTETELAEIIQKYGEERFAKKIAAVIKARERIAPIETAKELVEAIVKATPLRYHRQRLHPATRTFMALRIYANREIENLEKLLRDLERIMAQNGRAAVIAFHSLEDRLVKNHFRDLAKKEKVKLLTKKPIRPAREEIQANPRSRSARLRVIKMLAQT